MEERFLRIETKLAYAENEVHELSKVVYEQGVVIEQLQVQLSRMNQQLKSLGFEGDGSRDQAPPHY